MIFQSPFLAVTWMSMSTVSLLAQVGWILCLESGYSMAKKEVFQISLQLALLDRSFLDDLKNVYDHMFYSSSLKVILKSSMKKLIKGSSFSLYNYCIN